jgi:hypothetical protein
MSPTRSKIALHSFRAFPNNNWEKKKKSGNWRAVSADKASARLVTSGGDLMQEQRC